MAFIADRERMMDKSVAPSDEDIQKFLGEESVQRLAAFEKMLGERYDLSRELKYPFGSGYGWAYRYTHKKSLLLYVFFEKDGFCCTISINDSGAKQVNKMIESMLERTKELWQARYPCGTIGGWVNYSVANDAELTDIAQLVACKVKVKYSVSNIN